MTKKYVLAFLLVISFCVINSVNAQTNYSYQATQVNPVYNNQYTQQPLQQPYKNPLQGSVVMVPAGETVKAMLTTPLSSEYTSTGQTVSLALNDDFYYANQLIAPAGSTVYGTVIESSKAQRGGINGKCLRG